MSCKEAQELLDGYLDGELDLVTSLDIETHLRECKACATAYESRSRLRAAIADSSLSFKAPAKLRQRIQSSLRETSRATAPAHISRWRWLAVGASLALLALIVLFIWKDGVLPGSTQEENLLVQEIVSDHVRSLMVNHLTDVPSSDQHTVKPWFDGKLDFSPPVTDFTAQGFSLIGGRLEYLDNRAVAAIVYQRRQHFINLFIWPATERAETSERTFARQGYNLINWKRAGMSYWAVSDLNTNELQEFVRLVQGQT